MSRIGKKAIQLPSGVQVSLVDGVVSVIGPKGSLTQTMVPGIKVSVEGEKVFVTRENDEKQTKAYHGLIRSLIQNMVTGVVKGFSKTLKLIGVGYRVTAKGQGLSLSLGFSHPVEIAPISGITFKVEGNDTIIIEGIDKQLVGETAAVIRRHRQPEPYKGKGIRYEDEVVLRKAGKAAA